MSLLAKMNDFSVLAYSKVPPIAWLRIFQVNIAFNGIFILCVPLALIRPDDSYPVGLTLLLITLPLYTLWAGITWVLLAITQRGHTGRTLFYGLSSIIFMPISMGIMMMFFTLSEP